LTASVQVASRKALRIGCGAQTKPGVTVVDWDPDSGSDLDGNIDKLRFPFADDEFDEVAARLLIERSKDPMALMAELHRITRSGGLIKLTALHWTNPDFASDLRNRNHISSYSFRNLTMDRVVYDFYTRVRFNQRAARVTMPAIWTLMGFPFFVNLDRRYPGLRFFRQIWEHYLNSIVRAKEIHFELEVLKN
jgi:SAM-dependent methyltransferase